MAANQRSSGDAKSVICFFSILFAFSDKVKKEVVEKFEASKKGRTVGRSNKDSTQLVLYSECGGYDGR